MQTAIFDWFGIETDESIRYSLIRAAGFDRVMLWWGDEFDDKFAKYDTAIDAGLTIENAHLPYADVNMLWMDTADGAGLFQSYLHMMDQLGERSIPVAVMHTTSGSNIPPVTDMGRARFRQLAHRAAQRDVILALENVRVLDHLDALYQQDDAGHLGFCYDSGHHHCFTPDVDVLHRYGHRLVTLHLHDNHGISDEHLTPGDGTIDWPDIIRSLQAIPYRGAIGLEIASLAVYEDKTLQPGPFLQGVYRQLMRIFEGSDV